MNDLEWEFIDREIQRQDEIYAYIGGQVIGMCRPGGIIKVPAGYHPRDVELHARTD